MVVMDMDMGTDMGRSNIPHPSRSTSSARHAVSLALCGLLCGAWAGIVAAEPASDFKPRLGLTQIYTDNVKLAPSGQEDSDLITVIAPGFSLLRETARLDLDVNYQLRALTYVEDSDANRVHHNLAGNMRAALHEELLFLDASAYMGQSIIDARAPQSLDGVAGGGNLADVHGYSLSPYLMHNFATYATGLLRYGHERVYTDRAIQNAETNFVHAALDSGPRFGLLGWNMNYYKSREERGSSDTLDRENARVNAAYQLHPTLSLLGEWGWESNDFSTTRIASNGSYWAAGATWTPNRYLSLTALEGERFRRASVRLSPTVRTSMVVSYQEREVGLNPGSVWSGDFQHQTRRTVWRLNYYEDTQTVQRALFDQLSYDAARWDALSSLDLVLNEDGFLVPNVDPSQFFSLRDEVFERKRGQASVSFRTGKSVFGLLGFSEQRDFLESDLSGGVADTERTRGGSAHWRWQFSGRSHTNLGAGWRRTQFGSDNREDDLWHLDAMVTRALASNASASLSYRFIRNDSGLAANEYTENRIIARFNIEF